MIYIAIPEGMTFKQMELNTIVKDILIDEKTAKQIPLQDIVKDVLRHKRRRDNLVIRDGLHIYTRSTPYDDRQYLAYSPKNNGKYPTESTPEVVSGFKAFRAYKLTTHYGSFWYQHVPLSEERLEEVKDKQAEQRVNRRHIGDSPCPT